MDSGFGIDTERALPASADIRNEPVGASQSAWLQRFTAKVKKTGYSIVLTLPDGSQVRCGEGPDVAHVHLRNSLALAALATLDEGNIGQAYVEGDLDISGDFLKILDMRPLLADRHPLNSAWRFVAPLVFGQVSTNAKAIHVHYDIDSQFYLSFLGETRCYTQGIFLNDDEPLEVAIRRKFDYCIEACKLGPGSRVLEIGPGWGAFLNTPLTGAFTSPH